jgi:hypothetical protein
VEVVFVLFWMDILQEKCTFTTSRPLFMTLS